MSSERWPRRWRVVLGWGATLLICLIGVPLVMTVGAYLIGLSNCSQPTGGVPAICSPLGRSLGAIALLGGALVCFMPLIRSIQRNLLNNSSEQPAPAALQCIALSNVPLRQPVSLHLGQILASGRIESHSPSGRTILLNGETLTLWSLYPFQKGWLKKGDWFVVVYQKLPFNEHSNFLMAYSNGSAGQVRGVAAIVHTCGLVIMSLTALGLWWLANPQATMGLAVCGLVSVVDIAYLILMLRAKKILRRFLAAKM